MRDEKSRWWLTALCVVIFTNLIVILLPVFRGYYVASLGDEIGHLGMLKQISLTGHTGSENVYPISHILSSEVSYLSGLEARFVTRMMPVVFYLLYMLGLYLLAREMGGRSGQVPLAMAFGCVLLFLYFEYNFLPTHFFLLLVPLVLFLLLKKMTSTHRFEYVAVFVIMLILLPFVHPYGSILFVAMLLVFGIASIAHRALARRTQPAIDAPAFSPSGVVVPILIVFVVFFAWFWNFSEFEGTVLRTFRFFTTGGGPSAAERMAEKMFMAGLSPLEYVELFINQYGHIALFGLLSLAAIFFLIRMARFSPRPPRTEHIFFAMLVVVFGLLWVATMLGDFVNVGQHRTLMWALVASTLLNGVFVYEWLAKLEHKRLKVFSCLIAVVIIVSAIIGVFSVYPSPHTKVPNMQVTKMDWNGMEWFLMHKSGEHTFYVVNELSRRFPGAFYGIDLPQPSNVGDFLKVPPRYGYSDNETFGNPADTEQYLVITEYDRAYFEQLWPDVEEQVTARDFSKLNLDPMASRVYFNGGLEIWRVSISTD